MAKIKFSVEHPDDSEGVSKAEKVLAAENDEGLAVTTGNLLVGLEDCDLVEVEGYNLENLKDDQLVTLGHQEGHGTLTIYTQTTADHAKGDFIYTSSVPSEQDEVKEAFSYQVHTPDGDMQLTAVFNVSKSGATLGHADLGFVDEEGLLPGQHEALETFGSLDIDFGNTDARLQFSPLTEQNELIQANLSHQGVPLYYQLNESATTLQATQGANGPLVFEASLFEDGSYAFKLHNELDKQSSENLIHDPNFETLAKGVIFMFNQPIGWQKHESSLVPLQDSKDATPALNVTQQILTEPGAPYNLSFYFGSDESPDSLVEIYWNDKLVQTISGKQPWSGYSIGLEGGIDSYSQLKIIAYDLEKPIEQHFHQINLTNASLKKIPLEFEYQLVDEHGVIDSSLLQVQVSSEPPIILDSPEPFNIVYEQALYQSIIVQTSQDSQTPLTKLNLDSLFNNLHIEHENRQVEVVQLEENGEKTHVYEVRISDKASTSEPITVADVQLSFQGGDGGLEVFQKHILILDS